MSGLSPTLLGMPHFILENIVQKTDVFARCSLQKCSKHLQNFVPKCPFHFEKIKIFFALKMMTLEMTANSKTTIVKYCDPSSQETGGNLVKDADYIQRLVSDLVSLLEQDKVTVKKLKMQMAEFQRLPDRIFVFNNTRGTYPETEFVSDKDYFLMLLQVKLGQKTLKVRKLEYFICFGKTELDLLRILQVLEPGVLYSLYFGGMQWHYSNPKQTLPLVTETEQWKRAGKLDISDCQIPFEKLTHFKKIKFEDCKWTVADVDCLVQSAIAQGDDFGYYDFRGTDMNEDIHDFVDALQNCTTRENMEIGKLMVDALFGVHLEIRMVTEKYLEKRRRFFQAVPEEGYSPRSP